MSTVLRIKSDALELKVNGECSVPSEHNKCINIELSSSSDFIEQIKGLDHIILKIIPEILSQASDPSFIIDVGYDTRDAAVETNTIPSTLLKILAQHNIELTISRYDI